MNKLSKVLMIFWTIFCGIGLISGLANVGDVKTTNEFEEAGAAIGTAIGMGFWLSLWFIPTAILGIIALITKPKDSHVQVLEKPTLCSYCGKYYSGQPSFCPNCGKEVSK